MSGDPTWRDLACILRDGAQSIEIDATAAQVGPTAEQLEQAARGLELLDAFDRKELGKAYLIQAGQDYAKGGFEMVFRSEIGQVVAAFFAEMLKAADAPNYIAVEASHPELGQIEFICQRVNGESTAKKLQRLQRERDDALALIPLTEDRR